MTHWRRVPISCLIAAFLVAACAGAGTGSSAQPTQVNATPPPAPTGGPASLVGAHRCLSRALYLDAGGGSGVDTCPLVPSLVLAADGSWTWETRSGAWHIRAVTEADWQRWGILSYTGVTQTLVLDGWGDGPIESESGYIWVISHQDAEAGTLWMKWGPAS